MSGNQKPAPTVVPPQARFTQAPYLPRPPTPQRPDTFHVPTQQPYVPQPPPNQSGNQGPAMRGMAPTGPPTQSSTPPNSDLKVPQMSQQSMNITYVSQAPVRGGGQNFFSRGPPPQSQNPRMPNHRQSQQMYQTQSAQYVAVQPLQPMYCTMPFYGSNAQRPAASIIPPFFPSQTMFPYPQSPQTPQTYMYNPQYIPRPGPPPQVASAPQSLTQAPPPSIPLTQSTQPHTMPRNKQRRAKAIPIIDPNTGKDKLNEMYEQDDSHPASGESSARQTPQPPYIPNKEVQNAFTKQVNMVINQDKLEELEHSSLPSVLDSHMDNQNIYQPPPQAVHNMSRVELVQSSKLQVPTKEFVPAIQSSTAKEITPVVSANTDAAEVTITKCKDRESPAKSRKQREQSVRENREVLAKEASVIPEKSNKDEYKANKDEYKYSKETVPAAPNAAPTKEVKELNNQREEKKNQKKSEKVEQPKVSVGMSGPTEPLVVENVVNPLPLLVTQDNGKSKSRSKDVQKQAQQQSVSAGQKTTAPPVVPVPQTQPSKPNNKTNKMRELNMKGANKEGTDMDAFNDNVAPPADTNVTNCSNVISDAFNANDISASMNDSNKRNENIDLPTIKSDIKTLPKSKIDITDIVKDVPKPLKPYIAPVEPSQDETDRIELANNDKLTQPKFETAKPNVEIESNLDVKSSLPYKDDQWSPFNQDGKKIYDRDFLLALRNDPKSRKKPDNLLEVVAQEDKGRIGDINRYPMGVRTTDFVPNFGGSNYSSKSSSQRGAPPKRNSQQGKVGGGSKGKSNNLIKVSISVKEDVKLHETENAWKPARFIPSLNMSDEDKKTQELYRKVRGVLNKLTPQKFETLLSQVQTFTIDNTERLQGVIDLVFEKAVDEPNFSVAYALMCRELALMQVPAITDGKKKEGEFVNFRKLLVTRCQLEFEKNSVDENARMEKIKEIEECTDPEKKKELQLLVEEEDRRLRRKSVGNIRFIGELFKQQMLTVNIMMRCLNNLLDNKDEESLECLCKLLTTIGKEIDGKKADFAGIFGVMKDIVDKKHGKISSRVRFMLQDVIDLRNAKWIPRRQDLNPKTMDQIQKEADTEHLTIQAMNSVPITPRKDDRGNTGPNTDRKRARNNPSDNDGWTSAPTRRCPAFTVQSDKLKNKPPQIDEPLGSYHMFGNWGRGSNIKTTAPPPPPNTGNMYAALENIGNETDKRTGLGSRSASKDPYNSKGPSLERNYKHSSYEDGRGSRSGSQHRSNDNSQRSTPTPVPQQALPKTSNPPPISKSRVPLDQITTEMLELRLKNILEEYLNESCSVTECDEDIKTFIPTSAFTQLVTDSYINVLERSKTARSRTGKLFAQLIKLKTLSVDVYCAGLQEVLNQADDLLIDIPKIWDYLADVIAPVLCEYSLPLRRLRKCCEVLRGQSAKLLAPTFKLVIEEKGPNFLSSIWQESNCNLSDFMEPAQVNAFIKDNQFEFLLGGSNPSSVGQSELTYEQIHNKLIQFFLNKNSFDDIINWITANVGDRTKENQFVRTLATAVFEDSIVNSKLKTETLREHHKLLIRFVDGNPDYELQCLYALQALINKLEHPQGILLSICNSLYEENVFSHDSFVAWESSKDPAEQEGKGVALKQLTSFFTQIKEADDDSSSASEDA